MYKQRGKKNLYYWVNQPALCNFSGHCIWKGDERLFKTPADTQYNLLQKLLVLNLEYQKMVRGMERVLGIWMKYVTDVIKDTTYHQEIAADTVKLIEHGLVSHLDVPVSHIIKYG